MRFFSTAGTDASDVTVNELTREQTSKCAANAQSFAQASCNSNTLMNMRDILKLEFLFSAVNAAHAVPVSSINGLDPTSSNQCGNPLMKRSSHFKIPDSYNIPSTRRALDMNINEHTKKGCIPMCRTM